MSINEKKEFVCNVCGKNHFKHNMALKAHERWHNSGYRINISKKIKAKWQDPNSKYNLPEYKEKIKAHWQDPDSKYNKRKIENKPKEVFKFVNPQIVEYFEKHSKTHDYFDQKSIVKSYIRDEFVGNRIQLDIRATIEQSFGLLIKSNLEIGKIENYMPLIYRRKRGKVS